jgi:DNA-cytosine methyltransferase
MVVRRFKMIDLLLGGSPCQGFSLAGKHLNFSDLRSKLFFDYVKALEILKPKYFLLENVKMKKEYEDIITQHLGVKPIEINSALVSAQNRKRLYWTNIPGVTQPEDKGIMLKDIIHECEFYSVTNQGKSIKKPIDKAHTLMARDYKGFGNQAMTGVFEWLNEYIVPFDQTLKILDKEVEKGKVGYFGKDSQGNRVYYIHDKAVTLCSNGGGKGRKTGLYLFGCITPDRVNKRQNGQRFNDGNKFYTLTAQDRHGVLVEGYIRRLTPIEGERLQTLPDNYTAVGVIDGKEIPISNTQRYKMLGNGWTVDVIAHILSFIPKTYLHTVVSLFDGISCGQVALERAGKIYNQYYASEIDKYAIAVTQKNYPHTMQLGDVTKIDWNAFLDRLNLIQKVS